MCARKTNTCSIYRISDPAGKYTGLSDAYLSVIKSLQHACMDARFKLKVRAVNDAPLH